MIYRFYPKDGGVAPGGGGGAVTNWTNMESVFPDDNVTGVNGMVEIQNKLKLPIVMHNRQWSTKSDYIKNLKNFENYSKDEIYDHRKDKFLQIGRDQGFSKSSSLNEGGLSYNESTIKKFKTHLDKNKYVYGGFILLVFAGLIAILS